MTHHSALNGIADNGLTWRKRLTISHVIPYDVPNADINPTESLQLIISVLKNQNNLPDDFTYLIDNWDWDTPINKTDLIDFLNELYDIADYHRILIV